MVRTAPADFLPTATGHATAATTTYVIASGKVRPAAGTTGPSAVQQRCAQIAAPRKALRPAKKANIRGMRTDVAPRKTASSVVGVGNAPGNTPSIRVSSCVPATWVFFGNACEQNCSSSGTCRPLNNETKGCRAYNLTECAAVAKKGIMNCTWQCH